MDTLVDAILSNPWLLRGLSLVVFAIALVFIFKRLAGFAFTLIIILAAAGSGYAIFNHEEVSAYLRESYENFTGRELPDHPEGEEANDLSEITDDVVKKVKGWFKSDSSSDTPTPPSQ